MKAEKLQFYRKKLRVCMGRADIGYEVENETRLNSWKL